MKQQLLCTFTHLDRLPLCIKQIYKTYTVDGAINMKCYHYIEAPNNIVCIYNVSIVENRLNDTISINRKKETNTYYSINALNSIIRVLNNGVLDKSFKIEWERFTDMLLLANGYDNYKQIKIKELAF